MIPKVILLTDDYEIGRIQTYALMQKGLQVDMVTSVHEALSSSEIEVCNLIIVDIYRNTDNEIQYSKELQQGANVPILLFTYESDLKYVLDAYNIGIADCINKPLDTRLFLVKVNAWLIHSSVAVKEQDYLEVGNFKLNLRNHSLILEDRVVELTKLEFRLLYRLMNNPLCALETTVLIEHVWGYAESLGNRDLLKNLIYRLRKKIEPNPRQPLYIRSLREGYMFLP